MEKKANRPDWHAMLQEALTNPGRLAECYSVFHEFSMGNQILAAMQLFERGLSLSPIASFRKWKEQGRSVKRGEKAISLLMPLIINKADGDEPEDPDDEEVAGKNQIRVFSMKPHWFSLDQTDGEPFERNLQVPEWDKALAMSQLGITEEPFQYLSGNTQGYARPNKMQLAVSPLAALPWKTTFHEMGHCLLHSDQAMMSDGDRMPKDLKEAEAEAVAYLCCATLGLPGLEESRGYIQCWLGSPERSEEFAKRHTARVFSAANKILKAGTETLH